MSTENFNILLSDKPYKISLRRLFFEKLSAILADTPNELFDDTYWYNVYLEGIDHFINTPRNIVRLINTLKVTYPAVKGEVHAVDFVAIETIRVFCPSAYDIIRKNRDAFAGVVDGNPEILRSFHESWITNVPEKDREPIKRLLTRLFPKLAVVWGNAHYGSEWLPIFRKGLFVRNPDVFPVYFRLAVPEGDISNAEMKAFLALVNNPKKFGETLLELSNQIRPDGTTRVRVFLERFLYYTKQEIPLEYIPSIIQALFDVGDQLLRPEDEGLFFPDFGNDIIIEIIIQQLLRRLDEPERFKIVKSAIERGKAVSVIAGLVVALGQQHGKYGSNPEPEKNRLINAEHLKALEELALEKIRDAAKDTSLLEAPQLPFILFHWREWASEEEVKEWVRQVTSKDEGLVRLVEKFLRKTYSYYWSDVVGRVQYRLNPEHLKLFLDPSQVYERLKKLREQPWLTDNQKIAIEQFIREYERKLNK